MLRKFSTRIHGALLCATSESVNDDFSETSENPKGVRSGAFLVTQKNQLVWFFWADFSALSAIFLYIFSEFLALFELVEQNLHFQ